ncbi:MAG TPA: hypothetical protein VMU93_15520 [Caulobacteraceae bacterium]|nr:hypothetical protein [Caulobacteraceae bacterium]
MSRLPLLAAFGALCLPVGALAAAPAPDAAFDAFQNVCSATAASYPAVVKAADAGGWADTAVPADSDAKVTITAKMARSKAAGGETLMLSATQGLLQGAGGGTPVSTCKISSNRPEPDLIARAKAWLGYAPDAAPDPTLAVYYVKPGGAKPEHVAKANLNAALASGGLSVLKFQQDPDGAILVYQTYNVK